MAERGPTSREPRPTRRQVLGRAAIGAAVVVGAGGAGWLVSRRFAPPDARSLAATGDFTEDEWRRYGSIPREHLGYRRQSRLAIPLDEARAIAVAKDGRLAVAGDRAVRLFDRRVDPLAQLTLARRPSAVAFDAEGRLLVAMADRIEWFDVDRTPLSGFDVPEPTDVPAPALVTSVAAWGDRVFIADARHRRVLIADRDGRVDRQIHGPAGETGKGFIVPSPYFSLAVSADDTLWVTDPGRHRVERFGFDGEHHGGWGVGGMTLEGFCGCCNPCAFTILPDGRFVTAEKGLRRVKVYRADGSFDTAVADRATLGDEVAGVSPSAYERARSALDVAADADGRVLILDHATATVHVMVPGRPA